MDELRGLEKENFWVTDHLLWNKKLPGRKVLPRQSGCLRLRQTRDFASPSHGGFAFSGNPNSNLEFYRDFTTVIEGFQSPKASSHS
jgi:hypothetical protein